MALTYVPGNTLHYQALKSDLSSGSKITGAIYKGADVYFTDTQEWYVVLDDLTIVPKATQAVGTVSGNVSMVAPLVVPDITYNGQITISSSSIAVSGSTLSVTNRNGFVLKAPASNGGATVWFSSTAGSPVSGSAGGFPLAASEVMYIAASSLSYFNYAVTGNSSGCICWIKK